MGHGHPDSVGRAFATALSPTAPHRASHRTAAAMTSTSADDDDDADADDEEEDEENEAASPNDSSADGRIGETNDAR